MIVPVHTRLAPGFKQSGVRRLLSNTPPGLWFSPVRLYAPGPDQALEFAIYLNDTYQLDGRDPSGYVGCMWSIVGVHDQGWKERPIFGKIRYMAYTGCEKKFKIPDYIARVNELVAAVKAGKVDTSAINPGRFHIDFKAHLVGKKGKGCGLRWRRRCHVTQSVPQELPPCGCPGFPSLYFSDSQSVRRRLLRQWTVLNGSAAA